MNAISQISSDLSAAMALDLASDLWPESSVFANHGVTAQHGASLMQQDWFKAMVDDARREWSSISNAKQRIRLKSQIAVEMSINELYAIVTDANVPATSRVAAFKELKDVAGVAVVDHSASLGSVPTVNIFLDGDSTPSVTVSASAAPRPADDGHDIIDVTPSDSTDYVGMAPL